MNFDPDRDPDSNEEPLEDQEDDKFLDEEEGATEEETAADESADYGAMLDEDIPADESPEAPPAMDEMGGPPMPPPSNFDFAYPQLFFFLFCCLSITIGCLLPWERTYLKGNLTGVDSIGGGFLICFALYGVLSGFFNIYHRKMIVWPVLLAAIDGSIIGWQRVYQVVSKLDKNDFITTDDQFGKFVQTVKGYTQSMGPGLYLVTIFSTLILISIIVSVFKGAKEDSRRKQADRESRMEARKTRRS